MVSSEKPVAMTVTLISPVYFSSIDVPNMIFAFGSHDSVIIRAASSISNIERSVPPVIERRSHFAPLIESSRRGDSIAPRAASIARFSPLP